MYEALMSPLRIGPMEIRNRIAMSAMGVELSEPDGHAREPIIAYYEERARGGAGLIVSEVCAVAYPRGANAARQLAVSSDEFLPGLSEMADRVHSHGAKLALQLVHHGKVSRLDVKEGREVLVPSIPQFKGSMTMAKDLTFEEMGLMAKAAGGGRPKYKEATESDLAELVECFANATDIARRAGIDAVEIHAAHGYILSEFLSPAWNFREDEYGGLVEDRAKLLCEVIRACKEAGAGELAVWPKIDCFEYRTPNGIQYQDAQRTAELAVDAGADAISISAYADSTSGPGFTEAPLVHKEAAYVDWAAGIKARVPVPVVAVGRIEPDHGERIVASGGADVIAMARKLLADPQLPAKLREGRPQDVRPCIYCYTCVAQPFFDRTVRCAVNPVTAREAKLADAERTQAEVTKKVLVVGGGPSGMEAARVAALRGHDVILCEKSKQLGGTLRFAALVYEPNERLLHWLETQIRALGVEIRLETEVTPELVQQIAPDLVLVAIGARRARPEIPGVDREHVFDGDDLRALLTGERSHEAASKLSLAQRLAVSAGRAVGVTSHPGRLREASKAWMPVGQRVVVVGGGLVGAELAEFLLERGRDVTVLEESLHLATEMAHPRRWRVLHDLREHGAKLHANARVVEIGAERVRWEVADAEHGAEGEPSSGEIPADTVILAVGLEANEEAAARLRGAGVPVRIIGDATGVGYLEGAMHDGFNAAIEV